MKELGLSSQAFSITLQLSPKKMGSFCYPYLISCLAPFSLSWGLYTFKNQFDQCISNKQRGFFKKIIYLFWGRERVLSRLQPYAGLDLMTPRPRQEQKARVKYIINCTLQVPRECLFFFFLTESHCKWQWLSWVKPEEQILIGSKREKKNISTTCGSIFSSPYYVSY